MKHTMALCGLLAWPGALVMAQDAPAPAPVAGGSGYVTRDEYNKLQMKLDAAVQEMQQMKKDQAATNADVDKTIEEMMAKGSYARIILSTADLDATFSRLQASGADVVQEPTDQPWGVRDCAIRDPAGNLVRINEVR